VLNPAEVLNERYRLDAPIASGGMGEVWRATDITLARTVALKVMRSDRVASPAFDARFRAEARTMAALQHPNVVNIYDYGSSPLADGTSVSYLVMTYVDGESLGERLAAAGRLPVAETMALLAQAADALHAAHRRGIIHRDVKPANLLVQPDGTVVLVDFGVARSSAVTSVTTANAILGTALYMAPEQASGKAVSAATDIYALGAVAFHCLAGNPPFPGETALEIALHHVTDEPPPLPADLPPAARSLVSRALAKDPADRFPSAAAFAAAARRIAGRNAVTIRPAGTAGLSGADATAGADAGGSAGAGTPTGGPHDTIDETIDGPLGDPAAQPDDLEAAPRWPGRRRTAILAGAGAILLIGLAGVAILVNPGGQAAAPANPPATSTGPVVPVAAPTTAASESRRPTATFSRTAPPSAVPSSAAVPSGSASATPKPSITATATDAPTGPSQSPTGQPSSNSTPTATASPGVDGA
jgi:serine/threonine-protein kinase